MKRLLLYFACGTALLSSSCSSQTCSGEPEPCNYMSMANQCNQSAGCQSSAQGYCATLGSSSSDSCQFSTIQSVCQLDAPTCAWRSGMCAATSGCGANTTYDTCQTNPACGWEVAECTGTPQACSTHSDKNSCVKQIGCTWES
jgi:hypothetical protein